MSNYVTRTEFNALSADVSKILALLDPAKPAKVATPKKATRKAPAKKAAPKATPKATKCLTRKNRAAFVKAHPWAAGLSTQCIAAMVVEEGMTLKAGWAIGARYTEMFSA